MVVRVSCRGALSCTAQRVYSFSARGRCGVTSPKPLSSSRLSCPKGVTPIDHQRQKEGPPPSESRARDPEATSFFLSF